MSGLYLDHVLIAVRDLHEAAGVFSRDLGFNLTPEGVHPGRGTHNRLAVFGSEYLELIAVRDASEGTFRPTMGAFLQSREGLYMFALGTDDVDAAVGRARARGLTVEDPADAAREASGGAPGYSWRFAGVPTADTPGSETFLIQHNSSIAERYTAPAESSTLPLPSWTSRSRRGGGKRPSASGADRRKRSRPGAFGARLCGSKTAGSTSCRR